MKTEVLLKRMGIILNPVINYLFKEQHRRIYQYARYYETVSVKKNTILYESREGNSITDNPFAMFKYMLDNPKFKNYRHIWSVKDFESLKNVISKYKDYPNVKFVLRNSKAYTKFLATSHYLINNSTFPFYFIPKKEQIYINTWHGTPLKKMGYDIPGNPIQTHNVVRNFLSSDIILSPNSHTTNIFAKSYKLEGIYQGTILEEGYPRNDLTLNTNRETFIDNLKSFGVKVEAGKKNILYAPTWKGASTTKIDNNLLQIIADINELEEKIGNKYNIFIKVHPFLYNNAVHHPELNDRLIPDFVDTNELLATIDLLITDYSSIFFDFLITNKPILFYTWDMDEYSEDRGLYLEKDELPGPLLVNTNELSDAIMDIENVQNQYREKYKNMKGKFSKHDDGKVTERVVSYIFNNTEEQMNVTQGMGNSKKKILFFPGGMKNNGITNSFINLMNNIDYRKYDVTCFLPYEQDKEMITNIDKINKNVRVLYKTRLPVYQFIEEYMDKYIHFRGENGYLGKRFYPERAFIREHKCFFGRAQFDYCIDFSGYSLYWAKYLLAADSKRKICFMHSDMLSEYKKIKDGRRLHLLNLRGLFSIYNRFDKLVSVSEGTMNINRANLSKYVVSDKFDYVLNSINPSRVLQINETTYKDDTVKVNIQDFKARALLKNTEEIWGVLPFRKDAKQLSLEKSLMDTEIYIFRKATDGISLYYKFSLNYQVIGWIRGEAIDFLPDKVFEECDIDKIGKIINTKGRQIWAKPYKVEGCRKISGSVDYKDIVLIIDKEVQTHHGIYNRISLKGTMLGWINQNALFIYESLTINENHNKLEKSNIHMKRAVLITNNYLMKKNVLKNIHFRALDEVKVIEPIYAKIMNPSDHVIWTHACSHWNAKEIGPAYWIKNETVSIRAVIKTIKGKFYLFYKDNQKIGWLDSTAFKILTEPTLIKEVEVSKIALLQLNGKYSIWTLPYGLKKAVKIKDESQFEGSTVQIDREAITQNGSYSHLLKDNISIGWVNNKALKIKKVYGIEIDGMYIPEPEKKNINFVTMGRLSPEKGQDNLIKAFGKFHKKHPNSKLFILGEGTLKRQLNSLIRDLNLNESVHLLGQVEDPFPFLKKCDCFVLSSHYEGQPMVLLEAMTLGMKIIATDIVANRTVLENGKYGFLVENSIEGLEKGLLQVVNKEKTFNSERFNYKYYNEMAMESFYRPLN
ncbi:CDP-glycerol glycerophosphotransferase family protein [Bacillus sp. FJAT-49732]|uniref:CDP-glycerol glycerophosphotransferase family protein n=1 Tax=Lederbergia citrisecunda TaxID=2833583 RepID=A0A942TPS1_9BACI|nr:CDP-glycerol glycerophosphotransferase family protein [Lederbergia citrisecunda]MBS4200641.1 CDP-glycerol glycerophosphotransferase family protein [Lederbergia citrisecunda]